FFEFPKTLHRCAYQNLFLARSSGHHLFGERRTEVARRDRVNTYSMTSPLDGQRLRQGRDARFAGRVRGHLIEREKRGEGSDINNPAVAALNHGTAENLASA